MIGLGESLARATLGAVAHLGWWIAWQVRVNPTGGCVDAPEAPRPAVASFPARERRVQR